MNGAAQAATSSQSRILNVWNAVKSPKPPLKRAPPLPLQFAGWPIDEQSVENQVRNSEPNSTNAPMKPISSEACSRRSENPPFVFVASVAIPQLTRTLTGGWHRRVNQSSARHEYRLRQLPLNLAASSVA